MHSLIALIISTATPIPQNVTIEQYLQLPVPVRVQVMSYELHRVSPRAMPDNAGNVAICANDLTGYVNLQKEPLYRAVAYCFLKGGEADHD